MAVVGEPEGALLVYGEPHQLGLRKPASCGARLPIYALIIPAFFVQKYQAFVMWLMYFIGVVIALIAARIMKSTLFKGDGEVYLMELPPYRVPTLRSLLLHMWDRGRMYLQTMSISRK